MESLNNKSSVCVYKRGAGGTENREKRERDRYLLRSTEMYRILTKVRSCLATDPPPMKVKCQACSLSDWPDKGANALAGPPLRCCARVESLFSHWQPSSGGQGDVSRAIDSG